MGLSTSILLTIALAPLVGCVLAGFLGKFLGRAGSHTVTILGVAVSCVISFLVLLFRTRSTINIADIDSMKG